MKLTNTRLAYSYIRMSTEKQIKGDSLRRQLEWSEAYAAKNGLELQDSLRDIGVSAWKGKNRSKGKLGEFMRMVDDGVIPSGSYLLVESLDRLSRMSVMDALDLFRSILRNGITIVTMGNEGSGEQVYTWDGLNGDFGQLIITLTIMVRANEESERKSQRIREAFENKRRLSRLGVKTNSSPPNWIKATKINRGEYEYSLNERAPLVKWIFERSAEGVGLDRIARDLNAKAEPTLKPSTRGWFFTTVSKIITSRSAVGEYQPYEEVDGVRVARGDPISDYYPPVVTNDLWLRAQKTPHSNRKGGRAGTAFSNLLDGLAECAHCGSRMYMIANTRSDKQWSYLQCSAGFRNIQKDTQKAGNAKPIPVCTQGKVRFRYDLAERLILDNVAEFGASDHMRIQKADAEVQAMNEEISDLTVKLDSVRVREQRLLTLVEIEDETEIPGLLTALKQRTKERSETENKLTDLTHHRDVLFAKQRALDPASAIQAMREQWVQTDDDGVRYGLRVRTNSAMRDFIDLISFDSVEQTFTVILFGGLRAYKFPNLKNISSKSIDKLDIKPLLADMSRLLQEVPLGQFATPEATANADRLSKSPLVGSVSVTNDKLSK